MLVCRRRTKRSKLTMMDWDISIQHFSILVVNIKNHVQTLRVLSERDCLPRFDLPGRGMVQWASVRPVALLEFSKMLECRIV